MRFAVALSLLIIGRAIAAEPIIVELWPGKTPGDVGIKSDPPVEDCRPDKTDHERLEADADDLSATRGAKYRRGDDHLPGRRVLGSVLGA